MLSIRYGQVVPRPTQEDRQIREAMALPVPLGKYTAGNHLVPKFVIGSTSGMVWRVSVNSVRIGPTQANRESANPTKGKTANPQDTVNAYGVPIIEGNRGTYPASVAIECEEAPELDQRVRLSQHADLLAALEIAGGEVVAHVKQRRTSVNVLRFINDLVGAFPKRELRHQEQCLDAIVGAAERGSLEAH